MKAIALWTNGIQKGAKTIQKTISKNTFFFQGLLLSFFLNAPFWKKKVEFWAILLKIGGIVGVVKSNMCSSNINNGKRLSWYINI